MHVSLTPELESYVKAKVETGLYNSESEVMREALRIMEERDAMQAMRLTALKNDINQGVESLDLGKGRPLNIEAIKLNGYSQLKARQK